MRTLERCGSALLAALAGVLVCAGPARAEEQEAAVEEFLASFDAGVYSKYVWRGVDVVDDFVLQPSLDLGYAGFGFNLWGNLDLTDENGERMRFTEWDLTGTYTFPLPSVEVTAGAVFYLFPTLTLDDSTGEVFVSAEIDVLLAPTVSVYYDFDEVEGFYAQLSASHTFEDPFGLGEAVGLSPEVSASVGLGSRRFNAFYYGSDHGGLADLNLGLAVPWRVGEKVTLSASVNFSALLSSDARDAVSRPDNVWFGLSVGIRF